METKQPEQTNQNGGSRSDAVSGYLRTLREEYNRRANHITWENFLREKALFNAVEEHYYLLKAKFARGDNARFCDRDEP